MSPDQANTIRNRIQVYDKLAAEIHGLQQTINMLMVHRDKGMQIHFCGNSAWTSIASEITDEVRESIIASIRKRQASLSHEQGELVSPEGTVCHE